MKIKITTRHSSSSYGQPVILIEGDPVDYSDGIKAVREKLGVTQEELSEKIGVSVRTVQAWERKADPEPIGAKPLNAMAGLLGGGY